LIRQSAACSIASKGLEFFIYVRSEDVNMHLCLPLSQSVDAEGRGWRRSRARRC
jgi:hypothetical protein